MRDGLVALPEELLRSPDAAFYLVANGRESRRLAELVDEVRRGERRLVGKIVDREGALRVVANEIKLTGHWSADIGYPSSVQLPDGSILTAYYQSEREGEPPCLMGTLWRVVKP